MTHRTRHHKKFTSANLHIAVEGDIVVIGHGRYLVFDRYDTRMGGAVWLEVQRLPSQFDRRGGKPFRMMVAKRR